MLEQPLELILKKELLVSKKIIGAGLLISMSFFASANTNVYERNCIPCHRYQPASLEKLFMEYLKTYSGELSLKGALKGFLQNPTEKNSLMNDKFIENFSVKDKTILDEKKLDEALDTYWELYNVKNKLK